jgi:parallel beta-helix repeat protein
MPGGPFTRDDQWQHLGSIDPFECKRVVKCIERNSDEASTAIATSGNISIKYDTISDLRAANLHKVKSKRVPITVLGYYSAGDGGGGDFYLDPSDTTSSDDNGSVIITVSGQRVKAVYENDRIDIRRYGAKGDNSSNDGPAIQAAIDFAVANQIADVFVPEGTFVTAQTIQHKAPCNLVGTGTVFSDNDSRVIGNGAYAAAGKSCIKLASGANVPLINANADGRLIRTTNTTDDGVVVSKRIHGGYIYGIVLDGNGVNQTKFDCDLIKVLYIWNYTISNCAFVRPSGYCVWTRECNVVQIIRCNSIGTDTWDRSKGVLFWSTADSKIIDCDFGGMIGPTIQISGVGGWQNVVSGNFSFNSITYRRTVTGVSGNTVTFDSAHRYETGSPIQFVPGSGGSIPPELTIGRSYWAIRVSATQVQVAASYEGSLAGTALAITAGSGTYYGWHGYSSGLDLTWVASKNTVMNNRFDQHQQHGVSLYSANQNLIIGNLCNFNQYYTPTDSASAESAAGIALLGFCTNNVVSGNDVSYRTPNYPQDYGVLETGSGNSSNIIGPHTSQGNTIAKYTFTSASTRLLDWGDATSTSLANTGPWNNSGNYSVAIAGTNITTVSSGGLAVTGGITATTSIAATTSVSGASGTFGSVSAGTVLDITGGTSGVALFRIIRSGQPTIGFRNSGGLLMFDETNVQPLFKSIWSGSSPVFRIGSDNGTAPAFSILAGSQSSGTNVAGSGLLIQAGSGTGNASTTGTTVAIQTPNVGSSGSSTQSLTARATFGSSGVNIGPGADGTYFSRLKHGTAALTAGTVTVADSSITANSRIILTSQVDGGVVGFLRVSSRSVGVSFTISSSSVADTSTVGYIIIEP